MTLNQKDCQGGEHRAGDYQTCPWEFYYTAVWKLDTQGGTCVQNRPLSQFTFSRVIFWDTSCCNSLSSHELYSRNLPFQSKRERQGGATKQSGGEELGAANGGMGCHKGRNWVPQRTADLWSDIAFSKTPWSAIKNLRLNMISNTLQRHPPHVKIISATLPCSHYRVSVM